VRQHTHPVHISFVAPVAPCSHHAIVHSSHSNVYNSSNNSPASAPSNRSHTNSNVHTTGVNRLPFSVHPRRQTPSSVLPNSPHPLLEPLRLSEACSPLPWDGPRPSPVPSWNTFINLPLPPTAPPLSTLFASLLPCRNMADVLSVAASYTHTGAVTEALTEAARLRRCGSAVDYAVVDADTELARHNFHQFVITKSQQLLPSTLSVKTTPPLHLPYPALPILVHPSSTPVPATSLALHHPSPEGAIATVRITPPLAASTGPPSSPALPAVDGSNGSFQGTGTEPRLPSPAPPGSRAADIVLVQQFPSRLLPQPVSTPSLTSPPALPDESSIGFGGIDPDIKHLSLLDKFNLLATSGGPVAQHSSFKANGGRNVPIYPSHIAPPEAILQHFVAAVRLGKGFILRASDAISIAASHGTDLHVSPVFLTYKEGAPLMRAIVDYTYSGPNHPSKKQLLAQTWLPIINPVATDLCAALSNAVISFPGQRLFATRLDIDNAYRRIRTDPRHVPLMALAFRDGDEDLLYLPLTNEFGSQDSNYQYAVPATVLLAPRLLDDFKRHGCYLSSVYTDDNWHIGDMPSCIRFGKDLTRDAESLGANAIKSSKTILEPRATLHGYDVDCDARTIGITERIYMRFLATLCKDVPQDPLPGDRIPLPAMQKLSSYGIRCAPLMPLNRAHAKGFSWNTKRRFSVGTTVALTPRTIHDIWQWRYSLAAAIQQPSLLVVPISVPLLLRILPGESRAALADRQAAAAVCVGYADACTTGNGLGGFIPGVGYFSETLPLLSSYLRNDGTVSEVDINPLEFAAILLLAYAMVATSAPSLSSQPPPQHKHFHIWSDNASSVSWATRASASHPLHIFITQELAHLQARHNCFFTFGSIAGVDNPHADAASRQFKCPNGPALFRELNMLGRMTVSAELLTAVVLASK